MSVNLSLIQASFDEVKPVSQQFISYFYQTLFSNYPVFQETLRGIDLESKKPFFVEVMENVIGTLEDHRVLVAYLKDLGKQQAYLGLKEPHWERIGKSLLTTFRHFFGSNWTPELEEQWSEILGVVADCLLTGSEELDQKPVTESVAEPAKVVADTQSPPVAKMNPEISGELMKTARSHARSLLLQAIEHELEGDLIGIARKKISSVLLQALNEEVDKIQVQLAKAG